MRRAIQLPVVPFAVIALSAILVWSLSAGTGGIAPPGSADSFVEAEAEAEGADDYFVLQRRESLADIEKNYARALGQARQVVESVGQGSGAAAPRLIRSPWQLDGPTDVGGRISDLAVDTTQPDTIYTASASGGVWKSTDAGTTFASVWPNDLPQGTGAVAVDRNGKVWVGTGEANPGGGSSTFAGNGIYFSEDGGQTWKLRGLKDSSRIARIVIDPRDPNRIFVAAAGPLFSGGGQRGIYRTDNGGATWDLVLAPETPTAGGNEISIDPTNPDRIFATLWDRIRTPSHRTYGGVGSGLWRSLDGGDTWQRLENVVTPTPGDDYRLARHERLGRIGVAVAPSNPNKVYVMSGSYSVYGSFEGFYVSTDGGDSFNTITRPNPGGDAWWTGYIWVDPQNENHILVPGVSLPRSTNGGTSWSNTAGMHVDHHAIAWDPNVPGRVYEGNDGGTYRSEQNGATNTWIKATYEPNTQHYTVDIAENEPAEISTGLQDQGCQRNWGPNNPPEPDDYRSFGCGDGLYTPIDPVINDIYYGCSQYGSCFRRQDGNPGFSRNINNGTQSTRHNWKTPLVMDPNNPAILYYGGNVLNRSTDRGTTWTAISPPAGDNALPGLPTDIDPTYFRYGTITTIAVAKSAPSTIYVGTDNGRLWKTTDLGATWTEFTGKGLPTRWVSAVAIDPTNDSVAYATFTGFFNGENASHVFKTVNGGETWKDISGNLPNAPVNDVVVDTTRSTVYVATEVGVYYLKNGFSNWKPVGVGMPLAPVLDIRLHDPSGALVAATFGRGIWRVSLAES